MTGYELEDLKKKMKHARTIDELCDIMKNDPIYDIMKNDPDNELIVHLTSTLHNDMSTIHQWIMHPKRMMYSYIYQYVSFSTEIMIAIDTWSTDVLHDLTEIGDTIDGDALIHFMNSSVDELAAILGDFNFRYYNLGEEISGAVTSLKTFPKYLKQAIDAYSEVAKTLKDAKEIAYKYCDHLKISHKDFDAKVDKYVIQYTESANEEDTQPTE